VLTVRTSALDGRVYLSFADQGPGFPAELHEKLFEPYFTTKPQGLGLGLSISRSIIAVHGGELWGVSKAGHGAIFHIALPAA
jgi:two-component system sensor kinase FixL